MCCTIMYIVFCNQYKDYIYKLVINIPQGVEGDKSRNGQR